METVESLYEIYKTHPIITTDTRKCVPGSLFFALKGDRFNGNEFAQNAIDSGCAYAIIDEPEYVTDKRILYVENCLRTLQDLARYHRRVLGIPIIGITGTNGKTTTKELTAACLSQRFETLATEGNLNNHIGVPLTLLKLTPSHQLAVIEMGANHQGEIKTLAGIAEPDYGLITNVGKAHLEGFGSFEGVIRTKCELYDYLRENNGHIFIHHENKYLQPQSNGIEKTEYGEEDGLYIRGKLTSCSPFLSLEYQHKEKNIPVDTHLIGSYNLTNVLAAVAIAAYFGVPDEKIKQALEKYEPHNKRSQLQETSHNTLILDAYNANPTSMNAAIDNFLSMKTSKKAVILGDMRELGNDSEKEHKIIIDRLKNSGFDKILLAGNEFLKTCGPLTCFGTTDTLIEELKKHPLEGYTILIKGSRGMQLEKCIEYL